MKKYAFLFLFTLTACHKEAPSAITAQQEFFKNYARLLQHEGSFSLASDALTLQDDKIHGLKVHLTQAETLRIPVARRHLVDAAEQLTQLANRSTILKPYFAAPSLTTEDLDLTLSFQTDTGTSPEVPYVAAVHLSHGKIDYLYKKAGDNTLSSGRFVEYYRAAQRSVVQ